MDNPEKIHSWKMYEKTLSLDIDRELSKRFFMAGFAFVEDETVITSDVLILVDLNYLVIFLSGASSAISMLHDHIKNLMEYGDPS